jgi:hypothetical protein
VEIIEEMKVLQVSREVVALFADLIVLALAFFAMFRITRFWSDVVDARSQIFDKPVSPADHIRIPIPASNANISPQDIAFRKYWLNAFRRMLPDVIISCCLTYSVVEKLGV